MKPTQIALAILAAAFIASAAAQTTVYKWTDKDGKVHFSDALPESDVNATQKQMGGGGPENANLPYAAQVAAQRYPVTVYVTPDCGPACASAHNLLESRGVPYTERNPLSSTADRDALKKLVPSPLIPVLVVGDSPTNGFQEDQWNSALDSAGYPRTRLPSSGSMRKPSS
jgi:glutaredoxin